MVTSLASATTRYVIASAFSEPKIRVRRTSEPVEMAGSDRPGSPYYRSQPESQALTKRQTKQKDGTTSE